MQSFLLEINPAALTVDAADSNHIKLDVVAVALDLESMSARPISSLICRRGLHCQETPIQRLR
ncbi:MAG: hypothetical protein DMG76_09680 [Acidobacteria bacterium]|nr:MAG: hypothetical protein DMG76_09680 [Acidobacteriota bacterium]